MSEEIIKVLDYISEKFGLAVDWTSENVIPYFNELCDKIIKYEICTSVIWIVVFVLGIVLCTVFLVKSLRAFNRNRKKSDWSDESNELLILAITLLAIFDLCLFCGVIAEIFDIVKCYVLPEKYLFDFFTRLLKSNQ